MVLLNCETQAEIAPLCLKGGSPLVFTSREQLPVKLATKFVQRYLWLVNKEGVDAVEAIYDAQKAVKRPGFGPISALDLQGTNLRA